MTEPRPHPSHGSTHCADLATAAGIEVRRYTEEETWADPS